MSDVTLLLEAASAGDPRAAAELLPLVYDELRRLAAHRLAGERNSHTLQPTALVHEAWLKISGAEARSWDDRQHFFAAAAELDLPAPAPDDQLLAVNEALAKFATVEAPKAELVKLRYFVGMSFDEAAGALGIAVPTAKQWWAYSRAWLRVEIHGSLSQ